MAAGKEKCFTEWIKKNISTSTYQTSEITYEGSKVKRNTNKMLLGRKLPTGAKMIEDINGTSRRKSKNLARNIDINGDITAKL